MVVRQSSNSRGKSSSVDLAALKPLIPVIVGPTAVGKTGVAVALAEHWPVTVVSADSRQVYRGLSVGTAKPSAAVLDRVPHLGMDIVDPAQSYSAGQFARDAAAWLRQMGSDRQPVIVGGTGFYIRALSDGLFREPPINPDHRKQFRRWASGASSLGRWATRLDAGYVPGGRQRAARTVEIALLTGRPLSWWQRRAATDGALNPWFIRLTTPRAVLHERIAARVREMLKGGWLDEVQSALDRGVSPNSPGLTAVGYREVVAHLRGEIDESELEYAIVVSTRRYAKRQETWFRHQLNGHRVVGLDATGPADALAERIAMLWQEEVG